MSKLIKYLFTSARHLFLVVAILPMSGMSLSASHCVPDGWDAVGAASAASKRAAEALNRHAKSESAADLAASCAAIDTAIAATKMAAEVPQHCYHRGAEQRQNMAARVLQMQQMKAQACR